ncbi:recombination protein O N-terminal domain-containing protein [Croceicoccus sp. F390]|uniref:Recombination protein O N-terminal domain-containing protein n=1 Tax=Croceicoccus esteveae TaxID=3075597 RepID=A0ABU2ZFI1_9SPHN|nr:recombination protein O N-terminal domain-containing protein [Croceicoccus sp. F390]MDT0575160.1 recombination protein O N-terminal domain-containing protein [Croceicoccus sp. F390]
MQVRMTAIVCAARPHGETASIARLLTQETGLIAGYIAGGRGRMLRPVLIPGNTVAATITMKNAHQLPFFRTELVTSRALWMTEPLPAAAIQWVTALAAVTLPERQACPRIYDALQPLLDAICHAPSARGWTPALLRFETLLLREMGYGTRSDNLLTGAGVCWTETLALLKQQGRLVEHHLLAGTRADVMAARNLLMHRLDRITGVA